MESYEFWLTKASITFAVYVALFIFELFVLYVYGKLNQGKPRKDGGPEPNSAPKQSPPNPAPATPSPAPIAPKAGDKKRLGWWKAFAWFALLSGALALGYRLSPSTTLKSTTVTTTHTSSGIGNGFKNLASSVKSGVSETFAAVPIIGPTLDHTIGMTGTQSRPADEYDDSSVAECPAATMEQQECITDQRELVRRAPQVEGTLKFCWRWDPIDPSARFRLFGKDRTGPRKEIVTLQTLEAFDHLDLEPTGKIKFTYSLKTVCPE